MNMKQQLEKKYGNLSEKELSVLAGALSVYSDVKDLPEDIRTTAESLRCEIKHILKKQC